MAQTAVALPVDEDDNRIRINQLYVAARRTAYISRSTHIERFTPDMVFGKEHITVSARLSLRSLSSDESHWEPATVYWCSLGTVSAEEARLFAEALAWAAEEARLFDREHKIASNRGEGVPRT